MSLAPSVSKCIPFSFQAFLLLFGKLSRQCCTDMLQAIGKKAEVLRSMFTPPPTHTQHFHQSIKINVILSQANLYKYNFHIKNVNLLTV